MAPTSNETSSFDGDNFYNNLFTDLSPLLALFGEQVTKQFISQAISWEDFVLLSILPLGIITILVSTIRIAGSRSMKALIGRAREPHTDAVLELLPAVSDQPTNICEMWGEHGLVRVRGSSQGKSYLIEYDKRIRIYTDVYPNSYSDIGQAVPPNLLLNIPGAIVVLGYSVITTRGIGTPSLGKDAVYGLALFVTGTLTEVLGILGCSLLIYRSVWVRKPWNYKSIQRIVIQPRCQIAEDSFEPVAIISPLGQTIYNVGLTAPRAGLPATLSTLVSIFGFILQFIGLRALHWSVALMQLASTLLVTGIRAWERRNIAQSPKLVPLTGPISAKGSIPVALALMDITSILLPTTSYEIDVVLDGITHPSGGQITQLNGPTSFQNILDLRHELSIILVEEPLSTSDISELLCREMEEMAEAVYHSESLREGLLLEVLSPQNDETFSWTGTFLCHSAKFPVPRVLEQLFVMRRLATSGNWSLERDAVVGLLAFCGWAYKAPERRSFGTCWRIVGHQNLFRKEALDNWLEIYTSTWEESLHKLCLLPSDQLWGFELFREAIERSQGRQTSTSNQKWAEIKNSVVYCEPSNALRGWQGNHLTDSYLFCQTGMELFSIFFYQLTQLINNLGGTTTYTEIEGKPQLSNSNVDALVAHLAESDFFKSLFRDDLHDGQYQADRRRQAQMIIIPALAVRGLLRDLGPEHLRGLWVPEVMAATEVESSAVASTHP